MRLDDTFEIMNVALIHLARWINGPLCRNQVRWRRDEKPPPGDVCCRRVSLELIEADRILEEQIDLQREF